MTSLELSSKQKNKLYVVSGSTYPEQAEAIAAAMGVEVGPVEHKQFGNSELYVRYKESVRGKHVIAIQTGAADGGRSINDSFIELQLLVDAARRADAKQITAVMPNFPYGRQDRKAKPREPISAAMAVKQLARAGVRRIVSVDMHASQTQAVFNRSFDHLTAQPVLRKRLKKLIKASPGEEFMLIAPDGGRLKTVEHYGEALDLDVDFIPKARKRKDTAELRRPLEISGVEGLSCVLYDDMIDSGGTLVTAAEVLRRSGAARIIAATTHAIFSEPALERLQTAPIDSLIVTDTVPTADAQEALGERLEVLSVAPLVARSLQAMVTGRSVSKIFQGYNYQ